MGMSREWFARNWMYAGVVMRLVLCVERSPAAVPVQRRMEEKATRRPTTRRAGSDDLRWRRASCLPLPPTLLRKGRISRSVWRWWRTTPAIWWRHA